MIFRYCNVFQSFIFLILSSIFFHNVQSNAPNLNADEILKRSLRPLKYTGGSCENFCQNIICQPVVECNDGVILKNETYCGCCEACVKFLDVNDSCTEIIDTLGSKSRCKKGTTCKEGKCQLNIEDESCLRDKDNRKKHDETGEFESKIWIPECDEEGYYAAKQKKMTRSFCFNKSGKRIFGSPDDFLDDTCECSRYIEDTIKKDPIQFYVKPHEHCSSSGSFDTLQCIGNLCYCADVDTGDIKSELVRIDFLQNLNCSNEESDPKDYIKDCEKELLRTKKLAYEFWKKGVLINGIDRVACDPDGTFAPRQTDLVRYICTDKEGHGIEHYTAEIRNIPMDKMTCNCARDKKYDSMHTFSCEKYGSYQNLTCFPDKCVCVDEDGESVEPKKLKDPDKRPNLVCDEVLEALLDPNKSTDEDESFTDEDESFTDDYYEGNDYSE